MANTPRQTYRLPPELILAVRREAQQRHETRTDVVIRALRAYFDGTDAGSEPPPYVYQEMPIA